MNPLTTDSLTLLFVLVAKPDVMIKPDYARRVLGTDHQSQVDAADPLLDRGWIHRHLQANRSMTMGYSLTDAGLLASVTIRDLTNQSL